MAAPPTSSKVRNSLVFGIDLQASESAASIPACRVPACENSEMAGTLLVWKRPKVADEDAAARLLGHYYETGDESAFEASDDVSAFYDDVIALWPPLETIDHDDESIPASWSSTPERSDRIVCMDYVWSASGALLDDIGRLAREHGLVLYDPQGPVVVDPDQPESEYVPDAREIVRLTAILFASVAVALGAWFASITVVSWVVIAVAALVAVMAAGTLIAYAREARARQRA